MESSELTEKIIGCAFAVHSSLGCGFLESVYQRCMELELEAQGVPAVAQCPLPVLYRGEQVGDFRADLLVDGRVVVELKSADRLSKSHEIQLVNYLVAAGMDVGLLINFGEASVSMKRKVRRLPRS